MSSLFHAFILCQVLIIGHFIIENFFSHARRHWALFNWTIKQTFKGWRNSIFLWLMENLYASLSPIKSYIINCLCPEAVDHVLWVCSSAAPGGVGGSRRRLADDHGLLGARHPGHPAPAAQLQGGQSENVIFHNFLSCLLFFHNFKFPQLLFWISCAIPLSLYNTGQRLEKLKFQNVFDGIHHHSWMNILHRNTKLKLNNINIMKTI